MREPPPRSERNPPNPDRYFRYYNIPVYKDDIKNKIVCRLFRSQFLLHTRMM